MRYIMRQKLFCFGDDYVIKDDAGREVFYVDGRAFTLGDKLSFQDMGGNELAFIRQKLLAWGPTYEVYRGGELWAVVKKHIFTLLACRFSVDVPGPQDLEAQGNFMDMEYFFHRVTDGALIAGVSKKWFAMADTYGVEIAAGQDDVMILAATVVIDLCCHGDHRRE